MRLADAAHTSRPWRIHAVAGDFELVDVWALPTLGGPGDFPRLVRLLTSFDPTRSSSAPVRALFAIREKVGQVLGWDDDRSGAGAGATTLRDRLPADLREAPPALEFAALPARPLYLTGDEFAAEVANRTVHGVLHLGWVDAGDGEYRGQMAVLVKRNGLLGTAYLAAITPFRHAIVYPRLLRELGHRWQATSAEPDPSPRLAEAAAGESRS